MEVPTLRCIAPIGQWRGSPSWRAGLVVALVVVAMSCSNQGGSTGNTGGGTLFTQAPAFNGTVLSIALAGDGSGRLYVGGDFTTYNGTEVTRVVRLNPDGTVDTTFATGVGFNDSVRSIAPAGDGSGNVYVGGDFTNYKGTPANDLVRLHADGTGDLTFVTGAGVTGAGVNTGVRSIAPAGEWGGGVVGGGGVTPY